MPCPTCGVTRALIFLLKGDINGYFYYHPLAVPLTVSVLLMLHIKKLKGKWIIYAFVMTVLVSNIYLYITKLIT
jgi:hypothetical protein